MKEVDYIIVGFGLAGMAFAEICERSRKTFIVIDKEVENASLVAAGLYNPVILKRYSLPYKALEQFDMALSFYKKMEEKLGITILNALPVRKVFYAIEDQNNWFSASDAMGLDRFVNPVIVKNTTNVVRAPFDFGEVSETGKLDIKHLQNTFKNYLKNKNAFAKASFSHSDIQFEESHVIYQDYKAKHIVFAEGFGIKSNPFFNKLPLVGNKGEYIIIKAPLLQLDAAIKSSFFIVPLGDDLYKVGATYNWTDKDWNTTEVAKEELIEKLSGLITVPFEVVDQIAGIRPTTGDRRPLVGIHPEYKQLCILNGLGTRGVMAAPMFAKYLFDLIEYQKPLLKEIDILRFPKKFVR